MALLNLPSQSVFCQHITKDNYKGNWEDPKSWTPVWASPQNIILNFDAEIYGFITANSSISLNGVVDALKIVDTLVIHGDLTVNNTCRLLIDDGGVLIVRGNLYLNNQSSVAANGYLIVTGNLTKNGSITQGSVSSNDTPPKIFICGTISPSQITDNANSFPALSCTVASVTRYQNSACTYGNCNDLRSDPIYPFFQSTCINITAKSNTPVCNGRSLTLAAGPDGMTSYIWVGPNGFTSSDQNPSISAASYSMTGNYKVTITDRNGCTASSSVSVHINPVPSIVIKDPDPVCFPATVDITIPDIVAGANSGLTYSYWTDSELTTACQDPAAVPDGTYYIKGMDANGCYASVPVKVTVNPLPVVNITSSDNPMCRDETRTLTGVPAGGTFVVSGGPGGISGNTLSVNGTGVITVTYSYTDICPNIATQSIDAIENPELNPGPDQELAYLFETKMDASLPESQTGEWSLISGSGQILEPHSPVTEITGLKIGENVFKWSVHSGNCEAAATIKITVSDLLVPSVITPNGDGKNDFFRLNALIGNVELMIINKWGIVEYSSNNYHNDWDGRNDKGNSLKSDVYFYVLKFGNGLTRKGTVLIIR